MLTLVNITATQCTDVFDITLLSFLQILLIMSGHSLNVSWPRLINCSFKEPNAVTPVQMDQHYYNITLYTNVNHV